MLRPSLILAATAALVAGCDGGGDPVQQALRDTATANHAAVTRETASTMHGPGHAAATPASAGDDAFAASETEMHQRMMSASGETLDKAYIAKMIEHHRGAVAMAGVALARSSDPAIRRMAQTVKDAQTREIAEMQAWRPAASPAASGR